MFRRMEKFLALSNILLHSHLLGSKMYIIFTFLLFQSRHNSRTTKKAASSSSHNAWGIRSLSGCFPGKVDGSPPRRTMALP
jgi:hypothetical protein